MTATTMRRTASDKFHGPFEISYVSDGGARVRTARSYDALRIVLRLIGRMADRGRAHSIAVTDRYGHDVTCGSDILSLLESVEIED